MPLSRPRQVARRPIIDVRSREEKATYGRGSPLETPMITSIIGAHRGRGQLLNQG